MRQFSLSETKLHEQEFHAHSSLWVSPLALPLATARGRNGQRFISTHHIALRRQFLARASSSPSWKLSWAVIRREASASTRSKALSPGGRPSLHFYMLHRNTESPARSANSNSPQSSQSPATAKNNARRPSISYSRLCDGASFNEQSAPYEETCFGRAATASRANLHIDKATRTRRPSPVSSNASPRSGRAGGQYVHTCPKSCPAANDREQAYFRGHRRGSHSFEARFSSLKIVERVRHNQK